MSSSSERVLPLFLTGLLSLVTVLLQALPPVQLTAAVPLGALLDVVTPLLFALVARASFGPRITDVLPLLLLVVRALGNGAHATANTADIVHGHDLRDTLGRTLFWWHKSFAHYTSAIGEVGLLAVYLWYHAPAASLRPLTAADRGVEPPLLLLATFHGLALTAWAIGTGTVPVLIVVYVSLAWLVTRGGRRIGSATIKYALVWSTFSIALVALWAALHGRHLPTFDDLRNTYNVV